MDIESELKDAAKEVYTTLGVGFTENVYHRAFEAELASSGIFFTSEGTIPIFYKGHPVGRRRPDLFVEDGNETIVVELKASSGGGSEQLLQYLELLGDDNNFNISKGVLINFGDSLEIETESV